MFLLFECNNDAVGLARRLVIYCTRNLVESRLSDGSSEIYALMLQQVESDTSEFLSPNPDSSAIYWLMLNGSGRRCRYLSWARGGEEDSPPVSNLK